MPTWHVFKISTVFNGVILKDKEKSVNSISVTEILTSSHLPRFCSGKN